MNIIQNSMCRIKPIVIWIIFAKLLVSGQVIFPQEWSQWRGANRDGVISTSDLPKGWPKKLQRLWQIEIGAGHSSPIIAQNKIFIFSRQGDQEAVSCVSPEDGEILWQQTYPAPYEMDSAAYAHGKGPKSTPAAHAGNLITLGISGILSCYNIETGERLWRIESSKEFKASSPQYGSAMSPLITEGLCIAHIGGHNDGALIAVDLESGEIKWKCMSDLGWKFWKGDGPGYASPILATFDGTTQIVTFSQENIIGVDLLSGELLWKIPFTTPWTQNIMTPLLYKNDLILSGLEQGIMRIRVFRNHESWTTGQIWKNSKVWTYMSTPVLFDDLIVGFSNQRKGQYFCIDANTGDILWQSQGREGDNAALIRAGDILLSLNTEGKLIVAKCKGQTFTPLKEYTVADSPTWSHPLIFDKRIVIKDKLTLALWGLE